MAEPVPPAVDGGGADAAPDQATSPPWQDALDAARAAGGPTADPTRWHRIEALARRTEAHRGATRRLLDARLQTLLAELARPSDATAGPASSTAAETVLPPTPSQTLRALRARLEPTQAESANAAAPAKATDASAAPRDLKTVQQHRAAWTQLRAEQRVAQAHTALPDQAGPLNSQLLLHRALTLMRETAPGYLQHFMGQAEALMWLEQAFAAPAADTKAAPRGKPVKAPGRERAAGKSGGRAARG